jgi:hypothetical protein
LLSTVCHAHWQTALKIVEIYHYTHGMHTKLYQSLGINGLSADNGIDTATALSRHIFDLTLTRQRLFEKKPIQKLTRHMHH